MSNNTNVSEMLVHVGGELLNSANSVQEMQARLDIVRAAWNMSLNSRMERKAELKKFINKPTNAENCIQYLALDKKFHDLLSQNCGNKKLIELLVNLQEQIHWLRNISLKRITFACSIKEHLAIIKVLKKNDEELILKALLQHLERAKESSLEEINS